MDMFFAHNSPESEKEDNAFEPEDESSYASSNSGYGSGSDDDFVEKSQKTKSVPKTNKPLAGRKRESKAAYRNVLAEGGRAAVARRVTADLNEEDQIIVQMKRDGYTDRQIAEHLRDTGRINYNTKTIGTRWKRIRVALAKAKDEELDKGEATWTDRDDEALAGAVDKAERAVMRLKQQAEDSKWELVARELSIIQGIQMYSQRACRERYEVVRSTKADFLVKLAGDIEDEDSKVASGVGDLIDHSDQEAEPVHASSKDQIPESSAAAASKGIVEEQTSAARAPLANMVEDVDIQSPKTESTPAPAAAGGPYVPMALNLSIDQASCERLGGLTEGLNPTTEQPHTKARGAQRRSYRDTTEFSTLDVRANQAMDQDEQARYVRAALADIDLKPLNKMNRGEMRAELQARGLRRDGIKEHMQATLEAARAGATNLPASPLPADVGVLRELLKRKAVAPAESKGRSAIKRFKMMVPSDGEEEDVA